MVDGHRLFKEKSLYWGIIGVTVSLFIALENIGVGSSVLDTFTRTRSTSGHMLVYIFCAVPYACSIYNDLEHKYINYLIYRGNLKHYLTSKVTFIFLSSVFTIIMGTLIFCLLLRCFLPWGTAADSSGGCYSGGCYVYFIAQEMHLLYCLLYSLNIGLLSGLLSVCAACISLIIPSKFVVLSTPILILQILYDIADTSIFTVLTFEAYNKFFSTDLICFLFNLALSAVPTAILFFPMKYLLTKKI